jgi:CHAT domain-containing protein/tetratricopeptide (TPR) repeat protein
MRRLVLGLSERNSISAGAARLMGSVCLLVCVSSAAVTSRGSSGERGSDTTFAWQTTHSEARQADIRELKQGQPDERELAGGEAHSYRIALASGQYLKVVVEQKGIDVVVSAFGPDGQKLTEEDNHPAVGLESVFVVAVSAGDYRLEVRSQNKNVTIGRYAVKIDDLREATSKDRAYLTAQKAFEEANQLRDQGTADSRRLAIRKYEEALKLWQGVGDRAREADTLNEIGVIYGNMGDPKKALGYYDQAVPLYREAGDQINEATTMTNIGLCHWRLGESHEALKYHDQALQLRRRVGDRQGEAITFNAIGLIYSSSGQLPESLKYYDQALTIERIVGDRLMESTTLSNLGNAYLDLSELQKALESYHQGLSIKRAIGDRQGEGRILHNIAVVYNLLGERQSALNALTQALAIQRAVGNRQGEAVTLDAIGVDHARTGEIQKALECFSQALALSEAVGDRRQQAYVLNHYSEVYEQLGEPQKALTYSKQALTLMRAVGDRNGEALSLSDIGSSYASMHEWEEARKYFRQALQLSQAIGNRVSEAHRLTEIAHVERQLGNLNEARAQVELAVDILESTRAKVISQQLRSSFLGSGQSFYEFYIDLLMQMHRQQLAAGHDAAALQTSERARARSLLEILTEARVDIRQGVDTVLLELERSLQQQLSVKSERLTRLLAGKHTEEQETAARQEVEALLGAYQEVEAQIRAKSPRYAMLTQPQPLSLKAIQEQVLDEDTLLLEYALGEERSYVWAVTRTSITSRELPKRAVVEAEARRVYGALTARSKTLRFEKPDKRRARIADADAEYLVAAAGLSEMVLAPVMQQLGRKRLLIVSDGALQYVPFGALPLPAPQLKGIRQRTSERSKHMFRPLIADHEIVSLPSASIVAELRNDSNKRQTGPKTVAVLADPVFQDDDPRVKHEEVKATISDDHSGKLTGGQGLQSELERSAGEVGDFTFARLPYTRQEAKDILALTPKGTGRESLDFAASRATASSPDLSEYRIIHFATHALLNSQHPELSGVVLSLVDREGRPQDGFLRLYEIYNLKLGADLVVLSACRTALGKEIKGEGLVGLTRGFMYAGAPRVIASLWGIEDRSTAELMKSFYSEMLLKGQRPAAALRTAQLHMWREKQLPPYFWAAFVLQGEWK